MVSPPPGGSKYWAFLSYSHEDAALARRLHRELETYKMPRELVGLPLADGTIPERLAPIFIDRADFAGSADLSQSIEQALKASYSLVVLCSPYSVFSPWVEQEIRDFQRLGRQDRIIAAIARAGSRGDVRDVFPRPLLRRENADGSVSPIEPIAPDFEHDSFHNAKLRIIAAVLNLDFDSLHRRERRREQWRKVQFAIGVLILGLLYLGAADAGWPVPRGNAIRRSLDQRDLSVFRHVPSLAELARRSSTSGRTLIQAQLMDLEKRNEVLHYTTDGRLGGTWQLGQIVASIAHAPEASPQDIERIRYWIEVPFRPHLAASANGVSYGWLQYTRHGVGHPQAEASLWPIIAISALLARPAAIPQDQRQRFVNDLHYAENAASIYYRGGGWWHLPNQESNVYALYTTIIGLDAMLAVRQAREEWFDAAGRDSLTDRIGATAGYLIKTYDRKDEWRDDPGWHGTQEAQDVSPKGSLTLLAYAALLQAEAAEPKTVRLPPEMLVDIAKRVQNLDVSNLDPFATDQDEINEPFIDLDGTEQPGKYPWHLPLFPYEVTCTEFWLRRLQASDAPQADIVAVRRVLSKLIDQAPRVVSQRGDFYRAENLSALDLIH